MNIASVLTDADHEAALREIETLWGAEQDTAAGDRLDVLATLIETYEARRWPLASLNRGEAVRPKRP